jgi:hypothetical protein
MADGSSSSMLADDVLCILSCSSDLLRDTPHFRLSFTRPAIRRLVPFGSRPLALRSRDPSRSQIAFFSHHPHSLSEPLEREGPSIQNAFEFKPNT